MIVTPRASAAHKIRLTDSPATFIGFLSDFCVPNDCLTAMSNHSLRALNETSGAFRSAIFRIRIEAAYE
jgi:hypothetical protein